MSTIESSTDNALDAFWQVIAEQYPEACPGDLSPLTSIALTIAAERAVREWVAYNVTTQQSDIATGYRFRLIRPVDRLPDFAAPSGSTGIVTVIDNENVWGRMDQPIDGADQCENQIHWQSLHDFAQDTVPI